MIRIALAMTLLIAALFTIACGDDDDDATTAPTASGAATATASSAPATSGSAGETQELSSETFGVNVTVSTPSTWIAAADIEDIFVLEHPQGSDGPSGFLAFHLVETVYADNGIDTEAAPDDLAEFLSNHPRLAVQESSDVTVGGLSGVMIETGSSEGEEWKLFETSDGPFEVLYKDHIRFYVLDGTDGQFLIATGAEQPSRFEEFMVLAEPIIETIEIEQ